MSGLKGHVEVDVTDAVQAHIKTAIAAALSKDPTALVGKVVEAALSAKQEYGRGTVFEKAVNEMIRDAAKEEFRAWLDGQRELIRSAVRKRLDTERGGFVEKVADHIIKGLAESFYVSCHINVESDD